MNEPESRYSRTRDYVLLAAGCILLAASIGEGVAADTQLAVAFLGGALTCWGLVPTFAKDKER